MAPEEQIAVHDGEESVDSVWVGPNEALKGAEDGTYTIIFPTMMNVEYLSRYTAAKEAGRKISSNQNSYGLTRN